MWKMALILVLTALAMFGARLAYDAPILSARIGALTGTAIQAPLTPPLMYAGVRG
jgi:hypothetical protein